MVILQQNTWWEKVHLMNWQNELAHNGISHSGIFNITIVNEWV